ncbi:hypothetical protein FGO68_gene8636 [Halteria grandinella]|uniref:Lipocalin/cytosolic fatty-acid binding domain-containing protein n=1 Tax=Halteria grandinella TaxID=5974 RepID=A0A8J8NJE1_HALGN|nr:hypothetical protein FGO68_gene8636 [Halteria grandinella]
MKLSAILLSTLALLSPAQCAWFWGACPQVELQTPFDITQYVGKWYEYKRDAAIPYESGECVMAKYTLKPDGKSITVRNTQQNMDTDEVTGGEGRAWCKGDTAQCYVSFFYIDKGDYSVVSTDYTSYTVVKNCQSFFWIFRYENYWILSRTETISEAAKTAAEGALATKSPHYDIAQYMRETSQGADCNYLD